MSTEFSIYGICETCHKKRWFVRKRIVKLPINRTAKSQKKMCNKCYRGVNKMLETNK